jgi:threonine synthase
VKYVSTRGAAPVLGFSDVLLEGLARDGGLYVPDSLPPVPEVAASASYREVASTVMAPFVDEFPRFDDLVREAYAVFDHPDVCPIVELDPGVLYVQELWHGPTLAFKDVALQLVGRLMDAELERRDDRRTIVVATSGDTGSAAIDACVGRARLDIVVLHPAGRVSDIQRRQMTTVDARNVHNVAIEGTFDDCQDLVKALFADQALRERVRLGAMNSINWGRVLAQIPYYVTATRAVGRCDVVVPSGNFGNVLAGWYARQMGAPIERLVIGSNANDVLARWVATGALVAEEVVHTLSPAMDIQVSSNHERLVFDLLDRDGAATAALLERFRDVGSVEVPRAPGFLAARATDDDVVAAIARTAERTGYIADPHTAVGLHTVDVLGLGQERPVVCFSTAHPAKFPDAVVRAIGAEPEAPERLAAIADLPERCDLLPADLDAVRGHVEQVRSA